MTQTVASSSSRRRHVREPPSVPFLWEDRPGVAKKGWKPPLSPLNPLSLPPPVKLIASVPFIWEEKPGKPLPHFPEPPPPPPDLLALTWPDDQRNSELEPLSFETDDSFGSARSLSANCLVPTSAIAAALPAEEIPSSPASDSGESSASSYATGVSSLAGSSFLECLFPLYARNSSFSGDGAREDDDGSDDVARRTVTLGELIMMSRRKSYQMKAVHIRKQNFSMEFINNKALGCCAFGAGINMLEGLQRKRQHLLKLF